ncbi:hypothetical protein CIHG_02883 [Coccidioides immitis H538.4]|uniref:Uncharacterized protein n=1 Tax=Coccidioides immitis H538.4 TaxID=396776 RepID=A0A0J8RKD0_COCIT|nr:hypothetical protein CIHG_02883 [Coccidioides immitis H538.4]
MSGGLTKRRKQRKREFWGGPASVLGNTRHVMVAGGGEAAELRVAFWGGKRWKPANSGRNQSPAEQRCRRAIVGTSRPAPSMAGKANKIISNNSSNKNNNNNKDTNKDNNREHAGYPGLPCSTWSMTIHPKIDENNGCDSGGCSRKRSSCGVSWRMERPANQDDTAEGNRSVNHDSPDTSRLICKVSLKTPSAEQFQKLALGDFGLYSSHIRQEEPYASSTQPDYSRFTWRDAMGGRTENWLHQLVPEFDSRTARDRSKFPDFGSNGKGLMITRCQELGRMPRCL